MGSSRDSLVHGLRDLDFLAVWAWPTVQMDGMVSFLELSSVKSDLTISQLAKDQLEQCNQEGYARVHSISMLMLVLS